MFLFAYFSPSSQSPMMTLSFVIIVIIAALASPYAPIVKYLYTAFRTHPRSRFNASKTALSLA